MAASSTRNRKPTSFLRPTEEIRARGSSSNQSRSRPSRRTTNISYLGVGEEGQGQRIIEDDDEDDEVDITSVASPLAGESPQKTTSSSTSPARSNARRRNNSLLKNRIIAPDSSPDPSSVAVKEEPTDEDLAKKSNQRSRSKSKNGRGEKQTNNKEHMPLGKKIEQLLESIYKEEDENGLIKVGNFLKRVEKADFESAKEWEKYQRVVKSPICLADIQSQIDAYTSVAELSRDFAKLIQNAKKVNSEVCILYDHVDWLEETFADWQKTVQS